MLISANRLQKIWGLHPEVLLHIGAHEAEELDDYIRLGWGSTSTIWVEALPAKFEKVRERVAHLPNQRVINAVLWNESGVEIDFQETTNGQSSSALGLKDHADVYTDITVKKVWKFRTTTAADIVPFAELGRIGLLNIDIQGAELRALQGFGKGLDNVDAVYSEVNLRELYEGLALFDELDAWLRSRGFALVDSELLPAVGWGDALWIRSTRLPSNVRGRRALRRFLDLPRRVKFLAGTWWNSKSRHPNAR